MAGLLEGGQVASALHRITEAEGSDNRQEPCRAPSRGVVGSEPQKALFLAAGTFLSPRDSVPGSEGQPGGA